MYCTVAEIKEALDISSGSKNGLIMTIIKTTDEFIENYCDRTFTSANSTKYFDGTKEPLFIDDLVSIGGEDYIKLDFDGDATYEKTLASTDYNLLPHNESPKIRIGLTANSTVTSFAVGIPKGVQIKATFGYSTVPKSVRMAAIMQVCRFYKRAESAYGTIAGTPDFGTEAIFQGLDADVKRLLIPYRKKVF